MLILQLLVHVGPVIFKTATLVAAYYYKAA